MARVIFNRTFRFYPLWPSKSTYTEFLAGQEYTVKRACADQAISEGAAHEVRQPRRRVSRGLETFGRPIDRPFE